MQFFGRLRFGWVSMVLLWAYPLAAATQDSLFMYVLARPQEVKAEAYLQIADSIGLENPQQALGAANQAVYWAEDQDQPQALARALYAQGRWRRYTGQPIASIDSSLAAAEAYAISEDDQALRFNIHVQWALSAWWKNTREEFNEHLAVCQSLMAGLSDPYFQGQWAWLQATWQYRDYLTDSAVANFLKAQQFFEEAEEVDGLLGVKLDLAMARLRQRLPDQAIALRHEIIEHAKSKGSNYWYFRALTDDAFHAVYQSSLFEAGSLPTMQRIVDSLANYQHNNYGLFRYYFYKTKTYLDTGFGTKTLPTLLRYKALAEQLHIVHGKIRAATYLASIRMSQGYIDYALEELLAVSDLSVETSYMVARVHSLLARLYFYNDEPEKALKYRKIGVDHALRFRKTQAYYFYADYFADIGQYYGELGELEQANQYLDSSLHLAKENEGLDRILTALVRKGKLAVKEEAWDRVKQYMGEVRAVLAEPDLRTDPEGIALGHHFLAQGYYGLKQYDKSIQFGELALESNEHTEWFGGVILDHRFLWQAYEAAGLYQQALVHLKKYQQLKDTMFTIKKTEQYQALREAWEAEKRQLEIDLLQQDNDLKEFTVAAQKASLARNRLWLMAIASLVLVVLLLGWIFFNRYKLRSQAVELQLQRESHRLELENSQANQQLEMAKMRSGFLANVSHEIRTPLSLIKGPLESWKKDGQAIGKEEVAQVEQQVDVLMGRVEEALRLARSESAHLPMQRKVFSLESWFDASLAGYAQKAARQEIEWEVNTSLSQDYLLHADQNRLTSMLQNLVQNGLRYTPAAGKLQLMLKDTPHHFEITISDSGPGIDKQHFPHLFEQFYRADAEEGTGFGLGLAIVKEAIDQHGGSITLQSALGEGTTFYIKLPKEGNVALEAAIENLPNTSLPASPQQGDMGIGPLPEKATILVVEDHPELQQYLQKTLSESYHVLLASDGQAGQELAQKHMPDVIISDVMMPKQDGLQMLQSLKNHVLTSHIPVVMLTAKASIQDRLQGLTLGADHYLNKPFSPQELQLCLKNMIQQQLRLQRQFQKEMERNGEDPNPQPSSCSNALHRNPVDDAFLAKARQIIEEQITNEAFTIEQFCQELALNRTSVHQKLKALTGLNASGFIKSVRIRKAKELMLDPLCTISEVAHRTGFSNRQSFNRAFKEQTGVAPSAYRTA